MPFRKGKSKYLSKKTVINGITFPSEKEANRYIKLSLLERNGVISNLQMQVHFPLIPAQYEEITYYTPKRHIEKKKKKLVERSAEYVADFVYNNRNGERIVEDVKGYKSGEAYKLFKLKRKLMLYVYGIKVVEV